jgi:hypothetical protein
MNSGRRRPPTTGDVPTHECTAGRAFSSKSRLDDAGRVTLHGSSLPSNGYLEDPELSDENDADVQAELFELFRMRGWKPEDIKDPNYAVKYASWLTTATKE